MKPNEHMFELIAQAKKYNLEILALYDPYLYRGLEANMESALILGVQVFGYRPQLQDTLMKMKPDTTYRLSEITVNADELRRIKDQLDEQLAEGLALYRRVENLINQGTITKHATKKEAGDPGEDDGQIAFRGTAPIYR